MPYLKVSLLALALLVPLQPVAAQTDVALSRIESDASRNAADAKSIWNWAELGYQELKSSSLLANRLKEAGFEIEMGVAGMPTAFTATYGKGKPLIGILGEFDALPGVSQAAAPQRQAIAGQLNGHACGHHLFGVASASAAIALQEWLRKTGTPGTVRFFGTPAEEGGAGKVYLVRDGFFDEVDVVLGWHPADVNSASFGTMNALIAAKFRFDGLPAHAAMSPERGRSALDGVEAMNAMANMMREHVAQETRLHYVITRGGEAPSVVPQSAEVYYYVRHPQSDAVRGIFDRLVKISQGAALGTGTSVEHEVISGMLGPLPNRYLQELAYRKLQQVGGVIYTTEEAQFARRLAATLDNPPALESAADVQPFGDVGHEAASTDVGDVSWVAPMLSFATATWVPGTGSHTWQAVAAGGMSIGFKGMQNAAKVLALTGIDLYANPEHLERIRAEFDARRGPNFVYRPPIGNRKPPLDYMKGADGR